MIQFLIALFVFLASPAFADDLGCAVSGGTVRGASAQYTGTATSVVADVYDYDDLVDGTGYAAPTMTDLGGNNWGAADVTAGATTGLHKVIMVATVGGATVTLVDTFVVKTACEPEIYARLGTPAGASVSDDIAAVKAETALIYAAVDTEIGLIKTKTDFLPSTTAGAAGGLFIAGTNAQTTVTGGFVVGSVTILTHNLSELGNKVTTATTAIPQSGEWQGFSMVCDGTPYKINKSVSGVDADEFFFKASALPTVSLVGEVCTVEHR